MVTARNIDNTFNIRCRTELYGEYASADELRAILRENTARRILHVGAGSNLLFLSNTFDGLVLHNADKSIVIVEDTADYIRVRVGAGMVWDDFVALCISRGWYGIENLSLIPGEVGASAVQNIGAFGAEAGEFITHVHTLDLQTLEERTFTRKECQYAYRSSFFKLPEEWGRRAVLNVTYQLSKHFTPRLEYGGVRKEVELHRFSEQTLTASQLREVIISIRNSRLPDPHVTGNAGSFFKNPIITPRDYANLKSACHDVPCYPAPDGMVKVSAAWLIDRCGWKGTVMGKAAVHDKQALVLVNLGGAEGRDIVALSDAIRRDVADRYGVRLEPEVNFIS